MCMTGFTPGSVLSLALQKAGALSIGPYDSGCAKPCHPDWDLGLFTGSYIIIARFIS
jgi:hypothetical protein